MRTRPASLGKIDPQAGLQALSGTVGCVTGPVAGLKPNPLAGTGVAPFGNGVGTQLADFKSGGGWLRCVPGARCAGEGSESSPLHLKGARSALFKRYGPGE